MREFKFRYWSPREKKMVYPGGLCINWDGACKPEHEIMQFTGLKDKNGKEIFEGDIVRIPEIVPMKIGYSDRATAFVVKNICPERPLAYWIMHYAELGEPEVIGNIYENPKLLDNNND